MMVDSLLLRYIIALGAARNFPLILDNSTKGDLLSFFGETPQTVSEKYRSIWSLTTSSIYHGRHIQLIQYLIDHGGRVDYDSSCAGESFYDYRHREGNEDIFELIEKNGGFPDERVNPDP